MIIKESDSFLIERLKSVLAHRGIAIIRCDTIYGIVGIAPDSGDTIRAIKNRDVEQRFLMLIGSEHEFPTYSDQVLPDVLREYWPGPLTIVAAGKGGGTVALRVPADPFLLRVLDAVKAPLYSTSVNEHGKPPLLRIGEIIDAYERKVDCIVDSGDLENVVASTIIDITTRPYRIVRQGALSIPEHILA